MSVTTAGDASAYLTIEGDGSYVTNTAGEPLNIALGDSTTGINDEAITTLTAAVDITNNAADASTTTVGLESGNTNLSDATANTGEVTFIVTENGGTLNTDGSNGAIVTFTLTGPNSDGAPQNLDPSATNTASIDITINTVDDDVAGSSASTASELIIVAE
ncbi:hypothetical protein [Haloferax sp. YSSS75]|uniref:hypothetical protein n=1 Tax=Haloferax sp. YSSS75 TaxID=3388564 RepID=UPI00398D543F